MKQSVFLGCAATAALATALGVGACGSTAPSPAASPTAPAAVTTTKGPVNGIPLFQPSTVRSHTGDSAVFASSKSVTEVNDYYVKLANTDGWTIVNKSITPHSGNLTMKKSGQGATISVAPEGSGSVITISTYPTS